MLLTTVRYSRQTAGRRSVRRAAFTLLEVLIVVAILVILASAASFSLFRYLEDGKVGKAKAEMNTIRSAILKYYSEQHTWPQAGQLQQTIGPMIDGNPQLLDPWGVPYQFTEVPVQQADGSTNVIPVVICTGCPRGQFSVPGNPGGQNNQ